MSPSGGEHSPYSPQGQIDGFGSLARGLSRQRVVRLLVSLLVVVVASLVIGLVRRIAG